MKKIKNFHLFVLMISVLILSMLLTCSCGRGESELTTLISDSNININELITNEYSLDEMLRIENCAETVLELNSKFPIQCLRERENGYEAIYKNAENILVITFNKEGKKDISHIYHMVKQSSEFKELKAGDSIETVKTIDPQGNFMFLYTGRNDIPHISVHYTVDGYVIYVYYDENNFVSLIEKEMV